MATCMVYGESLMCGCTEVGDACTAVYQ